jgi:hypothetical protein
MHTTVGKNLKGNGWEIPGVDARTKLKCILGKKGIKFRNWFQTVQDKSNGGLLYTQ